jgi:hypothetical protein
VAKQAMGSRYDVKPVREDEKQCSSASFLPYLLVTIFSIIEYEKQSISVYWNTPAFAAAGWCCH